MLRSIMSVLACLVVSGWLSAAEPRGAAPPSPAEDGTLPALTAVAGAGMMDSHSYQDLEELADDIGGRVTGSAQCNQAIQWGLEKMKSIGLANVHAEPWQLARGWTRVSASAEIVAPIHYRLMVDSLGWVGSTPAGGAEAEVTPVNAYQLEQEVKEKSASWAGKVLLVEHQGEPPKDRFAVFAKFGDFLKAAYAAHAVAVIGGQGGSKAAGMHLTHTGVLGFDTLYQIPVVSMAAEDQSLVERLLDHGKTVRIKIDVQNRITPGPVDSANVVGEIPGTEHPDQIVVVGGHLDSWDLSQGATDNGMGTVVTLGAARAIVQSGFKPKRTIRFVLFTGEEQGLLGSLAYTKMHKDEMVSHVAALILDNGQGPVVGFNLGGRNDLIPAVQQLANAAQGFGKLKVDDRVVFGTDTGPFSLAGLPGINLSQNSPEYKFTHHSVVDTFDHVDPDILIRDTTVMAVAAFWIADRPQRLARPWPPEKTAKMLVEKHEDRFLKAIGEWPFGNLGAERKKTPEKGEQ